MPLDDWLGPRVHKGEGGRGEASRKNPRAAAVRRRKSPEGNIDEIEVQIILIQAAFNGLISNSGPRFTSWPGRVPETAWIGTNKLGALRSTALSCALLGRPRRIEKTDTHTHTHTERERERESKIHRLGQWKLDGRDQLL